jgi:hypothetical protein
MGKAGRLSAQIWRREFLLPLGGTLVAILGLEATIITIEDWHLNRIQVALLAVATVVGSFVLNGRRLLVPQLVVDDVIAVGLSSSSETFVRCPCSIELARQATKLAEQCFASSISIDPNIYEQLRAKNPRILACLINKQGKLLGYFDAIPVHESFAQPFLKGTITEDQITHEDVLREDEMGSCKYLFLSGIAVWKSETHIGRWNAGIITWAFLRYLEKFYGSSNPLVFAVAATEPGEALLQKFELDVSGEPYNRIDGYRLYTLALTRAEIKRRLASIPDWAMLCALDWESVNRTISTRAGRRRPILPDTKTRNRTTNTHSRTQRE